MGFNTTVVILNDALHDIESDPEFGKNLASAIQQLPGSRSKGIWVHAGNHGNAAFVAETHHADYDVHVSVGGNTARVIRTA